MHNTGSLCRWPAQGQATMARYWACISDGTDRCPNIASIQEDRSGGRSSRRVARRLKKHQIGQASLARYSVLRYTNPSDNRHAWSTLVGLIRSRRLSAGWIAVAIYLVCVAAPAAALALGSGPAPCFAEDMLPAAHTHAGGHGHDGAPGDHHHGKGLPGPCCVMLCAVAIAANLPSVAEPLRPVVLQLAESDRAMPGRTPPLLYRPPIA